MDGHSETDSHLFRCGTECVEEIGVGKHSYCAKGYGVRHGDGDITIGCFDCGCSEEKIVDGGISNNAEVK